jgi:hypothetical protein
MEDDDERCRERIDRVGMELPKVEVRFERLKVEVEVHVGRRALPTLPNFVLNLVCRVCRRRSGAAFCTT